MIRCVMMDAGVRTVAHIVIVKMAPVIPRMANVLVMGDLPDQNVTYLVHGDFMALTANKLVLRVIQVSRDTNFNSEYHLSQVL